MISTNFAGIRSVHYIEHDPGLRWIKDPQVVIDLDTPLDSSSILTPNIVHLPDGGFRLYYTGLGPAGIREGITGYILSAYSEDGLKWHKELGIRVNVHEPDATRRVLCPDVVPLPNGGWRMYFEARSKGRPTVIASSFSEDGLVWQTEPGPRVADPAWSLGSPRCIYFASPGDPNTLRYRLYYHHYSFPMKSGLGARNHIISAISDDGLLFETESGVRIAQESLERESYSVYAPEVIRLGDGSYRLYYSGWSDTIRGGIFSAISDDGLKWIKQNGPILDLDRPLDCRMISEPCVIELNDGRCRMYYEAQDNDGNYRILSATAA